MTSREIIQKTTEFCQDLDNEVPLYILKRDEFYGVINKYKYSQYNIINRKIYVEEISRKEVAID